MALGSRDGRGSLLPAAGVCSSRREDGRCGDPWGRRSAKAPSADVHAWAPGQVVKLFKAGVSRRLSWHEARMTRAVFAAGVPVPEVFGEVTLEGRFGIVLQRLDGPTLLQLSRTGAVTFEQAGAILATLCHVRSQDAPAAGRPLPARLYGRLVAVLRRHASEAHRHRHPRPDRAPAAGRRAVPWRPSPRQRDHDGGRSETHRLDLSRSARPPPSSLRSLHVILSELAPEIADNPERPRAINAAAQSEYARLAGMSPAALTAAIEPYLPIVRVLRRPRRRRCLPCGSG